MGNFSFRKCKIPTAWRLGTLGEISTSFSNQRVPLKSADRKLCQGQYRYFGAQGVIDHIDDYIFDGKYLLVAEDGENVKSRKYDIAFVVEGKFWVNNHAHVLQGNAFGDTDYLRYVLNFVSIKEYVTGQAQPKLNKAQLEKIVITIPPLDEQQKIAEVLSTVDKKIDLIDQKIAETVKLKTGLMQKLFSEGVGVQDSDGNWQPHSEFQDSPFGKVPSSWALETLEQRLDVIKDGTHFSPKSKEGPCKYLTSKNIRFGELDLTNISYISQEEHDRIYKGSPVKYGDILLTKDGANTGNAAINTLEEPFSLLSSVAYLRGSEKDVDHGYLLQLLLSPKGQSMMKSAMAGQAITRLTLKKIGAFVLPFAPIDEQNEIERILSTVDKKLQLLKKQKSETQQLKKGLMQKLLTGEWRVPVEETEAA